MCESITWFSIDLVVNPEYSFLLTHLKSCSDLEVLLGQFCVVHPSHHFKLYEPPRGKTNNVVSEQVEHKPSCTSTEDG